MNIPARTCDANPFEISAAAMMSTSFTFAKPGKIL